MSLPACGSSSAGSPHGRARLGPRDPDRQQGSYAGNGELFPQYASAKAGQLRVASSLAVELAGTGVTSNAISPGAVATDTFKHLYTEQARKEGRSTDWEDVARWWIDHFMPGIPLGRMITPREIADLAAFLASPCADAITGSDFIIDGGLGITGFRRQPSQPPKTVAQADA
jgi:NAD(P)-dependent dehydrogenase (short-subunit alcohol dehydrogenase family)